MPEWVTAEVSARHRLGDVDGFEVQHGHLEIRRQHEQGEELGDPGARQPQLARHDGPVGNGYALHEGASFRG